MRDGIELAAAERQRIEAEYKRRVQRISQERYAPWQPAEILMRTERKRIAANMLYQAGVFPRAGYQCLEIGYGSLGWLGDLITWGVRESDLHGIELDPVRAGKAKEILPLADLRVGDATDLPWGSDTFHLVVASTVFTSILDAHVRRMVAAEVSRVLNPGGVLLWYDFAINNPKNPHVLRVTRSELRDLFPQFNGKIRSVTLAPPVARFMCSRSWMVATLLGAIPLLRTHLLATLLKNSK